MEKGYIQLYRDLEPEQREMEEKLRVIAEHFNLSFKVDVHSPRLNKDGFDDQGNPYVVIRHFETAVNHGEIEKLLAKFESLFTPEKMKGWIAYYYLKVQDPDPVKDALKRIAKELGWNFESDQIYYPKGTPPEVAIPYINTLEGSFKGVEAIQAFIDSHLVT